MVNTSLRSWSWLLALAIGMSCAPGPVLAQGTAPMTLAISNGGAPVQGVTEGGGQQRVTIPEDLQNVQFDEGGPVVGAQPGVPNPALGGGTPTGQWSATWSVSDPATGDAVQDQSTSATATPNMPTPGTFEVHNGGARQVDPPATTSSGAPPGSSGSGGTPPGSGGSSGQGGPQTIRSSAAANTDVKDVTPPDMEVQLGGDGTDAVNRASVTEEPKNKPFPEKTVTVDLQGPNFSEDIMAGQKTDFSSRAKGVAAHPTPEELGASGYFGNDYSKLPKNRNRFDVPPSMLKGRGLYLKQHERSRVKFGIADNFSRDPSLPKLADGTPDWSVLPHEWRVESTSPDSVAIEKDASGFGGTLLFRKPNLDDPSLKYTLCFTAEDKAGNATELRIPVVVYPTAVQIDSLGKNTQKKD